MSQRRRILDLKPTQFAVGMLEVDEKIAIVRKFNKKKLRKFIDETPVPVVVASTGELYVVDHHHFLCVCYHVGVRKVRVEIVQDFSGKRLSFRQFWKWMLKTRNAYPFCQFGEGPHSAIYLPRDIRGLADDPYRSIAWYVRKAGAFEDSDRNFAEFKWANFFRKRGLLERNGMAGLSAALNKAVKFAQSPAARGLPGYDKLQPKERAEAEARGRKKARELKRERG